MASKRHMEDRLRHVGSVRVGADLEVIGQECRLRNVGCVFVWQFAADNLEAELQKLQPGDTVFVVSINLLAPPIGKSVDYICMLLDAGVTLVTLDEKLTISPVVGNTHSEVFRALASCLMVWERRRTEARKRTLETKQKQAGRQPKLSADDGARVMAMLKEPGATVPKVAVALGIGRTTLYRFLQDVGHRLVGKP